MSVVKRDYYEVLGVVRDCDDVVLKASYRKLALAIIPIAIRATSTPRKSSKKPPKPMAF